jgi:ferredoxin-NADP reductase/Na+-translocating ferredoxin:NAD+ oxidoreductase RnfD subunit
MKSPLARLDDALDGITMYRLVLYVLIGLLGCAVILAALSMLPFSPVALVMSAVVLVVLSWGANAVLAWAFDAPSNVESAIITALILALMLDPPRAPADLPLLGWAAILAMGSKYLLALHRQHFFNPAALAAVLTAWALREPASWWVGAPGMVPAVLLGGLLVVRKVRQEELVICFLAAALVTLGGATLVQHSALPRELRQLFLASPLLFVAAVMLTEPQTLPPTRQTKRIYGLLTGFLIVPQIHLGQLYSTPELALVIGNLYAFVVGPKQRVTLTLRRQTRLSPSVVDFAFATSRRMTFAPGQYLECTLAHAHPDGRGTRRFFTIASSPTEPALHLGVRFAARGSSFKRALSKLDRKMELIGAQIGGDFTLPPDPHRKLAFIAGGIGITPYRSMLKYLIDTRQRRDIVVVYATRSTDEIVYREILGEAQARLGTKVHYLLSDAETAPANWTGLRGHLSEQMVRDMMPDFRERLFYLSGPPGMVRVHMQVLKSVGVRRRQIKTDFFPGLM